MKDDPVPLIALTPTLSRTGEGGGQSPALATVRLLTAAAVVAAYGFLAVAITLPALSGRAALSPQALFDYDFLYRTDAEVALPIGGDSTLTAVDLPRDLTIARELHAGRWTNWNPLSAAGAPLWAEQAGPFFPLKLPFYLWPSQSTYVLFLALRLVVAACGAYALARHRGLTRVGAFTAGALLELCGATLSHLPFGTASASCMLPWVALGAEMVARQPTARSVMPAGIFLGLAGLGGHPTVILMVFGGYGAALAGHVVTRLRQPRVAASVAAAGVLALALGLALAAPSLLPLAELAEYSNSYKVRGAGERIWSLTLQLSRATAGPALLTPSLLQMMYAGTPPLFEEGATLGFLGLVLAGAGALRGGAGAPLLGMALFGVALTLAPPGLAWPTIFPGRQLIVPYYAWPLVALPLTQIAGRSVEQLATPAGRRTAWAALGLAVACLAVLLAVGPADQIAVVSQSTIAALFDQALATTAGRLRLLLPAVGAGLALAAATLVGSARWSPGLVSAMAIGELVVLWQPVLRHPLAATLSSPPSPAVAFLQRHVNPADGRMLGLQADLGHGLSHMLFGLADFHGVSAMPIDRYFRYIALIERRGYKRTFQQVVSARSPLVDLAAARYVVSPRRTVAGEIGLGNERMTPLAYADAHVAVYENRAALPRARIVHAFEPAPNAAAAGARLAALAAAAERGTASPLTTSVVLEPDARGNLAPLVAPPASAGESARITDTSDPDTLVIEATLASPGLVVVADTYYPGWRAWVDDAPAPIYPANLAFRAVHVPAGDHTIVMRYLPRSFTYGLLLGAGGVLACVMVGVSGRRRSAPSDSTQSSLSREGEGEGEGDER